MDSAKVVKSNAKQLNLSTKKLSVFSLLLVVFIDGAGIGLLFPILNNIILNRAAPFLSSAITNETRYFYYGLIVGIFFFCWFIGATLLSKASDTIGRKKALQICLYGLFAGYGITIIALYTHSLILLGLGRIVAGLTAGSQSVAQAAIIDISTVKTKAKLLGWIIVAFSLGMSVGPIIGGIFSDQNLSRYFSNTLPFIILLLIIVFNIGLINYYYDEKPSLQSSSRFRWFDFIGQFNLIFKSRLLRNLSLVFFIQQFSFNTFYVFISAYLLQTYRFSILENSLIMILLGISNAVSGAFLVPLFHRYLSTKTIMFLSYGVMLLTLVVLLSIHARWLPYLCVIPFMLAFVLAYTTMLTFFSNAVPPTEQGWVMGITVSLFTLGAGITAVIGGVCLNISIALPLQISVIGFIICLGLVSQLVITPHSH